MQNILILLFIFVVCTFTFSEEIQPKNLSEIEKLEILEKYGEVGSDWDSAWAKYLEDKKANTRAAKPKSIFSAPAEFEKSDGVCFSWGYGYRNLLKKLIKEVSLNAKAYVAVGSGKQDVLRALSDYGCNMNNVVILDIRLNSVWMRDYGPFFIYTQDGDCEIVDLVYNRPRPLDDKFPSFLAQKEKLKSYLCDLILPGGNLIVDGNGVAIMTDVVFDPSQGGDPNLSMAELKAFMKDYFGCHTVHVIEDMERDGTGHIDMFCKLLDEKNVIIGQYAKPSDAAGNNYEILNRNADKIASLKNGLGENFVVHRMIMPAYNWGTSYTHTNSLIVNKTVLVPIYERGTDEEALSLYQKLLPEYKIVGVDCNEIIGANGAIHCITKMVMSDPLKIENHSINVVENTTKINAVVTSNHRLKQFGVKLYWKKTTEKNYRSVPMDSFDKKNFFCELPTEKSGIDYYIRVEDVKGMYETFPEDIENALRFD